MIIGIVSTAQYLKETYAAALSVGNKEENNKTQEPAAVMALKESLIYDVDPKSEDFVISQNPADRTMCPDELHGCQSFDIRVSTSSGPNPPSVSVIGQPSNDESSIGYMLLESHVLLRDGIQQFGYILLR
ncbi:hypothetical protein PG984_005876 [Apiospora sp. TS-2023a]